MVWQFPLTGNHNVHPSQFVGTQGHLSSPLTTADVTCSLTARDWAGGEEWWRPPSQEASGQEEDDDSMDPDS